MRHGYPDKMTSPEYAAVLALSMIDGSFDPDLEDRMESGTRKDGTPIYGQHREAVWTILFDTTQIGRASCRERV